MGSMHNYTDSMREYNLDERNKCRDVDRTALDRREKNLQPSAVCEFQGDAASSPETGNAARIRAHTHRPVITFARGFARENVAKATGIYIKIGNMVDSPFPSSPIREPGYAPVTPVRLRASLVDDDHLPLILENII
ncbi:hypothetical protein EVAR_17864_1 [Eumeta japonica]|uniref:Uncharacterized protein n=1 Tax=Eumeta variegata TaxID=151549 RepID=A0A4C1ZJU7_EUMVA|nr:hypothetical protein EVAR_17864_1 [Eumeta japonica]